MNPKLKPIYSRLRKLLNPNFEGGAYGAEIANEARKRGVRLIEPIMPGDPSQHVQWGEKLMKSKNPVLKRIGQKLRNAYALEGDIPADQLGKSPININPLAVNPDPDSAKILHKKTIRPKKERDFISSFDSDKVEEAKAFPDIGETTNLNDYFEGDGKKFTEKLKKQYPEGYVVKKTNAASSIKSRGTKKPDIYFSGDSNISGVDKIKPLDSLDWLAQPDKHLKPLNSFIRKLDEKFFAKANPSGANEYRVTVVNGRVVPYAIKHRGSNVLNVLQTALPFRTPEIRRVQRYAEKVLENAHPDARKGHYAFDVGIDKNNKPNLIETNPGIGGANGYYFSDPNIPDAIRANIQEKLPYHVLARRALWGTAALGGVAAAGAGAYGASKFAMDREAYQEGFLKRASEYGFNQEQAVWLLDRYAK